MLDRDPTQGTTRSSGRTAKKLLFTAEQESIFLQTVLNSSSQYWDFCLTVWELGGRTSEVLGLKWSAVFNDHIRIENVLIHTKDGDQDAPPKTPGSHRTVFLSKECMDLIRSQPRRYVELPPDEKTGAVKKKLSEYVFTDAKGKPHSHRNWRRQWDQWLITAFGAEPTEAKTAETEADEAAAAEADDQKTEKKTKEKEVYRRPLVKVTPHSLRHLQAVRLFDSGWTIADVQARGGWESPKVLVSIYSAHSTEKKQRDMAEAAKISNGCQIGCQNEKVLPTEAEST
jgi:integrase